MLLTWKMKTHGLNVMTLWLGNWITHFCILIIQNAELMEELHIMESIYFFLWENLKFVVDSNLMQERFGFLFLVLVRFIFLVWISSFSQTFSKYSVFLHKHVSHFKQFRINELALGCWTCMNVQSINMIWAKMFSKH